MGEGTPLVLCSSGILGINNVVYPLTKICYVQMNWKLIAVLSISECLAMADYQDDAHYVYSAVIVVKT